MIRLSVSCRRCGLVVTGVSHQSVENAVSRMLNSLSLHQNGRRCWARARDRDWRRYTDAADWLRAEELKVKFPRHREGSRW